MAGRFLAKAWGRWTRTGAVFRKRRTEGSHRNGELWELDRKPQPNSADPADETTARHADVPARRTLTLDTGCACGHTRRDHTGLRMDVNGRCLECECVQFEPLSAEGSEADVLERIRAAIARVDLLREALLDRSRDASQPQPNGSPREHAEIEPGPRPGRQEDPEPTGESNARPPD